jgi:hypothetical protein
MDSGRDVIADLAQRLQSLSLLFCGPTPLQLDEAQRDSVDHATRVLDLLSVDLAPALSILPAKIKIAPNQHSWPETQAVMGVPVKSKKRKHLDPYGGNEQSGKKAKPDARDGPSTATDAPPGTAPTLDNVIVNPPSTEGVSPYYRTRPNVSALAQAATPASVLPPPALPLDKAFHKARQPPATFDPVTFNIGDERALAGLNNKQLKALCEKYGVDTARANAEMVSSLRAYHVRSQRPLPPRIFPGYPVVYPPYLYYPNYFVPHP